ncbi:cupin domain-containing protein [Blastococcus sp. SYSU D00695]
MPVTVRPRVPLRRTLDAFYDDEESYFPSARIVDWTLLRQEACDVHPYDEFAYVLEGTLVMESAGRSVEVGPGQVGMVPEGSIGCYRTPGHVRMISLGGPNHTAGPSTFFGVRSIDAAPLTVDAASAPAAVREAPPELLERVELPGAAPRYRFGHATATGAWDSLVLGEWELRAQQQEVTHPFVHFVFVLEGTLLGTSDGQTAAAGAGTMLEIAAGTTVRWGAPSFARVLEIDGPNRAGARSAVGEVTSLDLVAAGALR